MTPGMEVQKQAEPPIFIFGTAPKVRIATFLSLGGFLFLALVQWAGFLRTVFQAAEKFLGPRGWREVYDFGDPDFAEGFDSGFRSALEIWSSWFWLSWFGMVGLGIAFLLAIALWRSARWHQLRLARYSLLALLPTLFGLSLIPAWLVKNSASLVEVGLSDNPFAMGVGVGESITPLWSGLVLSILLSAYMVWSRTDGNMLEAETSS